MDEARIKEFIENLMAHQHAFAERFKLKLGEDFRKMDLGMPHMLVLRLLTHRKKAPILAALGRELSISAPMMTYLIDRLEEAGMLHRVRDDSDRRIVRVEYTQKGKNALEKCHKENKERLTAFLKSLPGKDQDDFVNALNTLINILGREERPV